MKNTFTGIIISMFIALAALYLSYTVDVNSENRKEANQYDIKSNFSEQINTIQSKESRTAGSSLYTTLKESIPKNLPLAHGPIRVKVQIDSVRHPDNSITQIIVKVDEVLGYGTPTRPVKQGETITVSTSTCRTDKSVQTTKVTRQTVTKNIISYSQQSVRDDITTGHPPWRLLELEN